MKRRGKFTLLILICLFFLSERQSLAENTPASLVNFEPIKIEKREGWEPLPDEEIAKRKIEMAFKVANATAELLDSLYMPYLSKGLFNIIGFGYTTREYHKRLKEKYHIGIRISAGEGLDGVLVYRRDF